MREKSQTVQLNKSLLCNITNSEFSKSFRDNSFVFENKATIGICVSGGPDSLALTILMNNWVKEKNQWRTFKI